MKEIPATPETEKLTVEKVRAGLDQIPRTGWVRRGIKNPETVLQHIDALVELARVLAPELPELNIDHLVDLLLVHDWPELRTGDIVTAELPEEEQRRLKADKKLLEEAAMRSICAELGDEGERYQALWREFEEGDTLEASFARQIDPLQALIRAFEYLDAGAELDPRSFQKTSRTVVTHPVLLRLLEELEKRIK